MFIFRNKICYNDIRLTRGILETAKKTQHSLLAAHFSIFATSGRPCLRPHSQYYWTCMPALQVQFTKLTTQRIKLPA